MLQVSHKSIQKCILWLKLFGATVIAWPFSFQQLWFEFGKNKGPKRRDGLLAAKAHHCEKWRAAAILPVMSRTANLSYPSSLRSHLAKRPKTKMLKCVTSLYLNTVFLDFSKKKWKSFVSPAINGFTSEVPTQALAVRLRRSALMQNRRSGQW